MQNDAAPEEGHAPRTIAIDIGGSHLKAGLVAADGTLIGDVVRIETPPIGTPDAVILALSGLIGQLGHADRLAAGFPGVVRGGVVMTAPNLDGAAWHGFPLAAKLSDIAGCPARVQNDATVQGLGVINGHGVECVITLGTGMGFALFENGKIGPHLELSQHPVHGHDSYDSYIGNAERKEIGKKRWNRRVGKVIEILRRVANFDRLLIGGGNTKFLILDLPADVFITANEAGITGGVKLWDAP